MLNRFLTRLNFAIKAVTSREGQVIIGKGIVIDLLKERIIVPGDFELHAEGNLRLTSDKHVIIQSGKGNEERAGYNHSIWLNSEEDEQGRPLLAGRTDIEVIDDNTNKHSK